MFDAINPHVNA